MQSPDIVQELPHSALPSCITATGNTSICPLKRKKTHKKNTYDKNRSQALTLLRLSGEGMSSRRPQRKEDLAASDLFLSGGT